MQLERNKIKLYEQAPFLRILLPLIAGICVARIFSLSYTVGIAGIISILLLCEPFLKQNAQQRYQDRKWFGIGVCLFFITFGAYIYNTSNTKPSLPDRVTYPYQVAVITDDPVAKEGNVKCMAETVEIIDTLHNRTPYFCHTILFFPLENSHNIHRGSVLLLPQRLENIVNKGNPLEFDYAQYMSDKQIYYQQGIWDKKWCILKSNPPYGLKETATQWRNDWLAILNHSKISPENVPILESLLAGYTQHLSTPTREAFATAGLSHILAVSGLHTGIIALLIYFLLSPLRYTRFRFLRPLLTMIVLWIYAFITGLSPATVRACIMATVWLTGECFGRRSDGLNSLAIAAFIMLIYHPNYLFDMGFQLSFASVASLVIVYPYCQFWYKNFPVVFKYLCGVITLSLTAQIAALPISLYHFHTFPFLFLLCNLAVIPLLPVIMTLGFLLLTVAFAGFSGNFISSILNYLLDFVQEITRFTYNYSSYVSGEFTITPYQLIFYFIIIGGVYYALKYRSTKAVIFSLLTLCAYLAYDILYTSQLPRNYFAVYNRNEEITLQIAGEGHNLIVTTDSIPNIDKIERLHKETDLYYNFASPQYVNDSTSSYADRTVLVRLPFIINRDKTILLLNNDTFNRYTVSEKLVVDYTIIGKKWHDSVENIPSLFDIKQIIIAAEVHPSRAAKIQKWCEKHKIPCHDIRRQGAFYITD